MFTLLLSHEHLAIAAQFASDTTYVAAQERVDRFIEQANQLL